MSDVLDRFVGELTLHVAAVAARLVDAVSVSKDPDRYEFSSVPRAAP
jgi:hypothetical protein